MKKKLLAAALLTAFSLPLLQGCVPVIATGVGAGTLMAIDRRPSETYLADEAIEVRALNRVSDKFSSKVHINATSYNMKVLLTGEAPDAAARDEIEKITASVANVKGVTNDIYVGPVSGFSDRSNDTYITSKVKARFIDANKFKPNHVKVVTEAGVVYLLGLVTSKEADDAAEIARTTAGVKKVVRVFEYISTSEAQRLDGPPPKPAETQPTQG
ncbi:MAG: BON domain-containing protein [Zoogloeaceae bacterium]|jgi:osmotically-inducible protein OsmY|nr:BON domain-containing protein [Zoogloeaceae bacterium]